jgi:D-alanyl-D-alanine dipeptidase
MKLLNLPVLFSVSITLMMQSCGLTGNNASKMAPSLVVIRDSQSYTFDIQKDTMNRVVSLTNYLHPLLVDFRYATQQNFTGKALYKHPAAFLRLPAARMLQSVQLALRPYNLGLKIYDAYRPYSVTVQMWEIIPDERYAANPSRGSGHNRGIAVDVTLVNLQTGEELPMPTGFDDFSQRAHHDFMQLDSTVIGNRKLLRETMEKNGFVALETEWWHYSLPDPKKYQLLDLDFDQLRRLTGSF